MKKAMKKLMAALMAIAMLCAMAVPAFADGETGTITVNNAVTGKKYNFYRILDIATHTSDDPYTGIVYKTNTTWDAFVKDARWNAYFTVNNDNTITVASTTAGNDTFAKEFAAAAQAYAKANSITPDLADQEPESGKVTVTVPLGYYMVESTGWDTDYTVICSLDTTKPSVTINEKNGKPTIEKKIIENGQPTSENDAAIGDYVQFQVKVNVIDGQPKNYVIHDKMSTGLDFVNDTNHPLKVLVGSRELDATEYDLLTDTTVDADCTFEVKIHDGILTSNDVITVTYFGKINSDAEIITSPNTNDAKLTYGDNGKTEWEQTKTYVWGFDVEKYTNKNGSEVKLAGAKFIVYRGEGENIEYATFDNSYKFTGWKTSRDDATVLTTPTSGEINLVGLDSGSYKLEEIEAPEGYNKLTAPISFTIGGVSDHGKVTYTIGERSTEGTIRVLNNAGTTLPGTGGIGTTIFYVIGGGLMVAAAVLLITKKRMENKN